jgi:hypothetical protein
MSKLDPRLPHRVQEWASTQPNAFVSERDADAIVAWLRAQRGSDYARKPVDGLRKQVVRVIGQLRAPPKASTPGTPEWSIDASPDTAAANSTAGSGSKRSLEAASAAAGMVPHLASASKVAKTAASGGRETMPSGGAGFNLLNASLRASPAVTAAAAAAAAVAAESPAPPSSDKPPAEGSGSSSGAAGAGVLQQQQQQTPTPAPSATDPMAGEPSASARKQSRRERKAERRPGGAREAQRQGGGASNPGGGSTSGSLGYASLGGLEHVLQEVLELPLMTADDR